MSAKRAQISANECKFKKGNNAGNAGRPLDGDGRRDLVNLVERFSGCERFLRVEQKSVIHARQAAAAVSSRF